MKRLAVIAVFLSAFVACSGGDTTEPADRAETPGPAVQPSGGDGPSLMAAALEQLVTKDHTFGDGPPPFSQYLVQSHLDGHAGSPESDSGEARPLSDAERSAIEAAIRPLGPLRWIDDPDQWRTKDLRPTVEGAVILGIGEPTIDGDTALVPVSLWCGGLCGTWLTYRLAKDDGTWRVTGTEGPVAIS